VNVDVPSPAQMKRWLLQCHRLIHWDQQDEVRGIYASIGLLLREMVFRPWEGLFELRFWVRENTDRTVLNHDIQRVTQQHGGRVCNWRVSYAKGFCEISRTYFGFQDFGPSAPAEIVLQVELCGARSRFGEAMATGPALHAYMLGR
jgi:hypothetical protein